MLPFEQQDLHIFIFVLLTVLQDMSKICPSKSLHFWIRLKYAVYLDRLPEYGNLSRQVVVLHLQSLKMCFHLHKISVRDDVHYVVHDFLYGVFQKFDKLNMPIAPCYRRIYPEDVFKDLL